MSIWSSLVCNREPIYHFLRVYTTRFFYLETIKFILIIVWWLILRNKPLRFWREIWVQVILILLQLYPSLFKQLILNSPLTASKIFKRSRLKPKIEKQFYLWRNVDFMFSPVLLSYFMGLGSSTITGLVAFFTTETTFIWFFAIGGHMTFFAAL